MTANAKAQAHAALSRRAAKACNAWIFPQTISRREFAYAVDAAESFEDLDAVYQAAILLTEEDDEPPPPADSKFSNDCHSAEDGRFCETHGTKGPPEVPTPEGLKGAALIDHFQDEMGMVQTTDEHTNPERYEPNKGFGVHLKLGESETHLEADTDRNPILVDYVSISTREAMLEVEATGKTWMELGIKGSAGSVALKKDPATARPLPHVFRIVSEEDYQGALKRGYYQSDGRMNLVETEGTVTAGRELGTFYASEGMNRYLRFKVRPEEGWKVDPNDEYIKTQRRIPIETIDLVSVPFHYDRKSGHVSLTASAAPHEFYNRCHSKKSGQFCETITEKASPAERAKARASAKAKVLRAPVPSQADVKRKRAMLDKIRAEGGRPGGDNRGKSVDRKIRQHKLWVEFGGPEKGYVVDAVSGVKMHYTDDPVLNPKKYPEFTQGKIFTTHQGGGYRMPNLLPELLKSNQSRGDNPIREENTAPLPRSRP